jgi:hypothetical protein
MEVVNKLIDTEEALVNQFDHDGKQDACTSGAAGDSSSKFRKRPSEVLVADGHRPSTLNIEEFNAVLDSPCTFHEGGTHTVCECQQFKRVFRAPEDPKRPRSDGDRSSSRRYNNNRRYDRHGLLTVKFRQPSHEFTFGVGMTFISYPRYNKFIRACRFWSLVFMQGFSIESKTSGISSSSTL